jgi:ABC-type cobalt transport system substrate-binding protein
MHYIGLDVHKRTISFAIKQADGTVCAEGEVKATRAALEQWLKTLPQPWSGALEATMFTGWIYDYLLPHAAR